MLLSGDACFCFLFCGGAAKIMAAEEEGEIEEADNDVGVGATYKLAGAGEHAIWEDVSYMWREIVWSSPVIKLKPWSSEIALNFCQCVSSYIEICSNMYQQDIAPRQYCVIYSLHLYTFDKSLYQVFIQFL